MADVAGKELLLSMIGAALVMILSILWEEEVLEAPLLLIAEVSTKVGVAAALDDGDAGKLGASSSVGVVLAIFVVGRPSLCP